MNAADLIAAFRSAGFDLEPEGATVNVYGEGDVPADLLAALRAHKPAVLHALGAAWCPGHAYARAPGCFLCGAEPVIWRVLGDPREGEREVDDAAA